MLRRNACKAARLIRGHTSKIFDTRPTGEGAAVRAFSSILCDTSCFQGHSSGHSNFSHSGETHLLTISRGFSAEGGLDGQSADESAGQLQDASALPVTGACIQLANMTCEEQNNELKRVQTGCNYYCQCLRVLMTDDGGFLGADAISQAAEMASLAESWDNAWYINKGCQWLIQTMHEATGSPWYCLI